MKLKSLIAGIAMPLLLMACSDIDTGSVQSEPLAAITPEHQPIETSSGVLSGVPLDGGITVYRGVPFAQPPVGDLRWRAPQPVSWDGVLEADAFAPACLQPLNEDGSPNGGGYFGPVSEDCLYMNIWAPENAENAPIMLWLFGGGGVVGAGNVPTYDGTEFARDGVILVTINYRLGPLAGFAHPALTESASEGEPVTNFHLLDALAALQWMKDNAAAFGGNPDNVLVFGESAGATMTANLLTSPLSEGVIDKAIIESTGSLRAPGTPLERAEELVVSYMDEIGLDGANLTVEELRGLDTDTLFSQRRLAFGFRTIIDPIVKPLSIMDAFEQGAENDIPFIIGSNSDEGRLAGTQQVATYAQDGEPVWQYFFHYVPEALRELNPNGAPHAGEIPFVFNTIESYPATLGQVTDEDRAVADFTHACWVDFAWSEPGETEIDCNGMIWPARTEANDQTVITIDTVSELGAAQELRSPPNGAEPGRTSRPG